MEGCLSTVGREPREKSLSGVYAGDTSMMTGVYAGGTSMVVNQDPDRTAQEAERTAQEAERTPQEAGVAITFSGRPLLTLSASHALPPKSPTHSLNTVCGSGEHGVQDMTLWGHFGFTHRPVLRTKR